MFRPKTVSLALDTRCCVLNLTAMGGPKFQAALKILELGAEDRCCVSCYFCYYRKFLDNQGRDALLATSKDCRCDFMPHPTTESERSRSTCTRSRNGGGLLPATEGP